VDAFSCSQIGEYERSDTLIIEEYIQICASMGYLDINIPKYFYSLQRNSNMKSSTFSKKETIESFYSCGFEQFASTNSLIVNNREYLKIVTDVEKFLLYTIVNADKLLKKINPSNKSDPKNPGSSPNDLLSSDDDKDTAEVDKKLNTNDLTNDLETLVKLNNKQTDLEISDQSALESTASNEEYDMIELSSDKDVLASKISSRKFDSLIKVWYTHLVSMFLKNNDNSSLSDFSMTWATIDIKEYDIGMNLEKVFIINKLV